MIEMTIGMLVIAAICIIDIVALARDWMSGKDAPIA